MRKLKEVDLYQQMEKEIRKEVEEVKRQEQLNATQECRNRGEPEELQNIK